jgi:hypothetical protein
MSDRIDAFFQLLQSQTGLHPSGAAAIALLLVLLLAVLSLFLFAKLKGMRALVYQVAERLGHEPPYGNLKEIFDEEFPEGSTGHSARANVEELEQRIRGLEEEGQKKDANLTLSEERAKVLDDRLQQASLQNDVIKAQVGEQVEAHRLAAEQLEVRMRQMELESLGNLTILQRRSKELENQLQQAIVENEKITAHFNDESQAHRQTVEQLEQRLREMEAEGSANAAALQQRSKELEDQLQTASLQNEKIAAEADEQARSHRSFVEQLEERIRQIETEGNAYISTLERRSKELEDHLHQASILNDRLRMKAGEQAQIHQNTVEQFEQRMREMVAESAASHAALQQRARDLEEQLQKATIRHERVTIQASEQVQAYRVTVDKLEQRIRETDSAGAAKVAALQQRAKELEEKLQQAAILHERMTAQADEQERTHRATVDQFDQRMRDVENTGAEKAAALQQRAKDLEEKLEQAAILHERMTAQADEQERTHRATVDQFDQRMRDVENTGAEKAAALQQRAKDLEEKLEQAALLHEKMTTQADEQERTHRATVDQFDQRMRDVESDGAEKAAALQQRAKELEEKLEQAALLHEKMTTQADELERTHRATVDQLDQRMRDAESSGAAKAAALQQRAKELEDALQEATVRHEKIAAQADEQAQAHKLTVEQLEQRVRAMEAESGGNVSAFQQRARELEDQLRQATERHENEMSIAHQESTSQVANLEQLTLEIRGLEAERDTKDAHLQTLQTHVKELEEQLQQSAGRMTVEKAKVAVNSSEQFLRRAEWITACTVGPILPHGLIAAETYASAALAANPQSTEASQLLAELARIHRAHPEGLPSAKEAVTTFDEKAAAFFAGDLSRAADLAEDEANRRARAGMNRSALLTAGVALELRQKSDPADGAATTRLTELKASLLGRAGNDSRLSNATPGSAS